MSVGFTGAEWATTLSSATYTAINTADWTVSYWVGADETAWNTWMNKVQAKGALANPTEATDTARFSAYMLSLKMDGPAAEGDGVVMVSTGSYAKGAVALVLGPGATSVETHRMTASAWTVLSTSTNQVLSEAIKLLVPLTNNGFWSFWSAQSASPWTCTAWQPTWVTSPSEPSWSAAGVAANAGSSLIGGLTGISIDLDTISLDAYPRFGTMETQEIASIKQSSTDALSLRTWTIQGSVELTLAAAAAGAVAMLNF